VPDDGPPPPVKHFKLGMPTATWRYTDLRGATLGFVYRFDMPDGDKVFRPLTFARTPSGGKADWRWESWTPMRPLYGLAGLAKRVSAPVVVTEGEKAADAAAMLLGSYVAVTSPNGSKSAAKADWSPLRDRDVTIWPDADAAGLEYAHTVAEQALAAGATSVAIVSPPDGVKAGWDAADAIADGWNGARAGKLVLAAEPFDPNLVLAEVEGDDDVLAGGDGTGDRRRTPQRDQLVAFVEDCVLWHDASREAYVTFLVNDHREHWPVRSRDFRMWLSGRFYKETGGAIGGQALEDGIRILEARAVNDGPQYEPFMRVGHREGALYLDLCDTDWRAVEITGAGWKIIEQCPIKFLRTPSMRPLPEPEAGSMIETLSPFVNVKTNDDFMLVVAWLVATLRDRGPYPILVVSGEQGSGKSLVCRTLRTLVDPSAAPIRSMPKDDRDLIVSAYNSRLLAFDNLSSIPSWLSDALCRLATGGGFATRQLHTDKGEVVFEGQRALILNGIPSLTDRADLADRAINVHLEAIPEERRRPEDEIEADFAIAWPGILGALLDGVSAALRNVAKVKLQRFPRMADFAKWCTAAEPGLGWESGAFVAAYGENRRDVSDSAFEADNVAVAICDMMAELPNGWEGTATALLAALNARVPEGLRRSRTWPDSPQRMGNRVERAKPLLRRRGITIVNHHSTVRNLVIVAAAALETSDVITF
jgi:hypothetical protein